MQPTDVGTTPNYDSFVGTACFGPGVTRTSYQEEIETTQGIIRKAKNKFQCGTL